MSIGNIKRIIDKIYIREKDEFMYFKPLIIERNGLYPKYCDKSLKVNYPKRFISDNIAWCVKCEMLKK